MGEHTDAPRGVDISVPNVARMYDFYLGGKDNYASDREAARQVLRIAPFTPALAWQNRAFMARAVRYLAGAGVTQFLDIGTGLPTQRNVHEIAQDSAPGARVVYVDNDPVVVVHGRALLGVTGNTTVVERDMRRPAEIIDDPQVRQLIDFAEPVGLLMVSALHCLSEADEPYRVVATLRDALAPGSHLVVSHVTGNDEITSGASAIYDKTSAGMNHRGRDEILRFFTGFEILDPGLVRLDEWRPDGALPLISTAGRDYFYCGVGRKEN